MLPIGFALRRKRGLATVSPAGWVFGGASTRRSDTGAPRRTLATFQVAYIVFFLLRGILSAAESWPNALARMPLMSRARQLNRTNCVDAMLRSFESNAVVKALIFMPGATDEFYLFRRAKADLTNSRPTLLDAIIALTNQTCIRAAFHPPLLLLHTDEDPLEPEIKVEEQSTARKLKERRLFPHLVCNDKDWDFLQPILRRSLQIALSPWRGSRDSWHFYRHTFVAWGLNGEEALETVALAGKSKFTIHHQQVIFEVDSRVRDKPQFDLHLH